MIDEEFKAKMQGISRQAALSEAALRNARQEVERSLEEIDEQIGHLAEMQAQLLAQRAQLSSQLGRPSLAQKVRAKRQRPGALIEAYTAALKANRNGLTSAEVIDWIRANRRELIVSSIPAVLSRGVSDGRLKRDELGRYMLT